VLFMRGDGGFSERSGVSDPRPERLRAPPDRAPDIQTDLASLPQAALIYRLNGDYNPLHCDPEVARAAGFPRPILHGLCSFGMAAHAVLKSCCDYQPARIRSIAARFTAPVFPGETLRFSIWRVGEALVHFRATVDARATVVLDHGVVELGPKY
jgi:acyl dehydratase